MIEIVTAVYEKGVLRPLSSLNLRDQQTVRLQIVAIEDDGVSTALQELAAIGAVTPPKGSSDVPALADAERDEIAAALGRARGRPLSEVIIAERGDQ